MKVAMIADADQSLQGQPAAQPRQHDHEEVPQHVGQRHQQQGIAVGLDPGP